MVVDIFLKVRWWPSMLERSNQGAVSTSVMSVGGLPQWHSFSLPLGPPPRLSLNGERWRGQRRWCLVFRVCDRRFGGDGVEGQLSPAERADNRHVNGDGSDGVSSALVSAAPQ